MVERKNYLLLSRPHIHHIVGMDKAGTVIAINPDEDAPIFDYADYGIIENFENIFGGRV